jgi:hypothetical protein
MNVIVNCHYKEKTIKEGVGDQASERQELALQLQGSTKDTIFNDLDLACFMGGYYAAVDGQRVRKRGLTFKATPERPFLKDRLGIMPDWMEVTFSENDYLGLFDRLNERIAELDKAGANAAEIGEIPPATDSFGAPPVTDAAPVGPLSGGPLPQQSPAEAPLASRSKVELVTIARDMGLNPKGNALKSELIEAIDKAGGLKKWQEITEAKDSGTDAPATAKTETPPDDASPTSGTESPSSTDGPVQDAVPSSGDSKSAPVNVDDELTDAASETFTEDDLNEAANLPQCMKADGGDLCVWDKDHGGLHSWESPTTDAGEPVNTTTGEIGQKAQQVAANNAAVEEPAASAAPAEKPKLSTPAPGDRPANCSQCGNDIKAVPPVELTGGEPLSPVKVESYLRVAFIKARNHICCTCFLQRQKKSA